MVTGPISGSSGVVFKMKSFPDLESGRAPEHPKGRWITTSQVHTIKPARCPRSIVRFRCVFRCEESQHCRNCKDSLPFFADTGCCQVGESICVFGAFEDDYSTPGRRCVGPNAR